VFAWKGSWWLLVDPLEEPGIWAFRSEDGAAPWVRRLRGNTKSNQKNKQIGRV
jgi:hypothetical protein